MKKLLVATLVGIVAATAPLPAQADGPGWVGTCRISTVYDETPTGTLGGGNVWNGQVNIAVAASTTGATISAASCSIRVNSGSESTILTATPAGPVAVGAGRAVFTAAMEDTVEICTNVTTSSHGANTTCATLTTTPICPAQVCGEGGLLDQLFLILDGAIDQVTAIIDLIKATRIVGDGPVYAAISPGDVGSGPGYVGSCHIAAVNDTTPGGTLGGGNVWNGQVSIAVAASTTGATVSAARCTIKINSGSQSTLLTATPPPPAVPVAVGAGRTTFTAAVTDTMEICTHVTTTSHGAESECAALTVTPICPVQVCGDGGLLDQIDDVIAGVIDPTLCEVLRTLAPTVNSLPTNTVLSIDPATGDTYVGGTGPSALFRDCFPYVEG